MFLLIYYTIYWSHLFSWSPTRMSPYGGQVLLSFTVKSTAQRSTSNTCSILIYSHWIDKWWIFESDKILSGWLLDIKSCTREERGWEEVSLSQSNSREAEAPNHLVAARTERQSRVLPQMFTPYLDNRDISSSAHFGKFHLGKLTVF